ncbi:hypothetical protein [Paenibacillus sp. YN15]|uniref:hypothetical protein n=1 Tax=Paenibacillus sp. YN15 TaxID=1742774 RepID=UPI000DCE245A|nr:hypothetical protein [Paenibacillus sp. YN15]RAV03039.1 hypothetical protein DQG13_08245 [Paenibacillus sp. YN15]
MSIGAADVGAIRATLTLKTTEFKAGMDDARKRLKETETSAKSTAKSIGGIETALVSLGASTALVGLVRTIKSLTAEANTAAMSVKGLAEVSKALNVNIAESTGLAQELANKGFMTLAEASSSVKTLLSSGLGLDETRKLIYATADAAAYNREAHLSWGEAIVQVTRGIKSGNSELTDAAGITTNLSVFQDRYAKSIGTTADKLSEAQKVQAAYSGIMQESALYAGNADTALQGYAGTQAVFNQTITVARQELGEAYLPAIQKLMEALTPLISDFGKWVGENEEVVAGITAGTLAITGLTAVLSGMVVVISAVRTALQSLNIALGPVGWTITAISVAAAGILAYKAAVDAVTPSILAFANSQDELNKKLEASPLNRTTEELKKMQADYDTLNDLLRKRTQLSEELARVEEQMGRGLGTAGAKLTPRYSELADAVDKVDASLKKLGFTPEQAAAAVDKLTASIKKAVPAQLDAMKAELADVAAKTEQIDKLEQLRDRYTELSKKQSLDAEEKAQLISVIQALKKEMPSFHAQLTEEGTIHSDNIDMINDRIEAEKKLTKASADEIKARLLLLKEETAAQKTDVDAQIAKWESYNDAYEKAAADPNTDKSTMQYRAMSSAASLARSNLAKLTDQAALLTQKNGQIDDSIAKITAGNYAAFTPKSPLAPVTPTTPKDAPKKTGKTAAEIAAELRRDLFAQDLATMRYNAAMYDQSADDQIAAIESIRKKHAQYLTESIEDERSLQLQIKALNATKVDDTEKAAKAQYDYSAEWIAMEERRLREKGATEAEVAQMALDAWTRVKAEYKENSDEYKAADKAQYDARMTLIKEAEKAAKEADEATEKRRTDASKAAIDAIDREKKAELSAIEAQKKARKDYYDAQIKALDSVERQRDRSEIQAEAEKYRLATSEQGQKHYAELIEQLRKMDVDDQKSALADARDAEIDTLDRRKDDIESWYDEIKASIESFSGDVSSIYAATEDSRFQAFVTTNARIKAEMERFTAEMSAMNSVSTPQSSYEASIIRQMKSNAAAWWTASESGRKQIEAESQTLGASIGASYNNGSWYKNGVPLFHSGGVAGGMSFASGSALASDELRAILRQGEVILTPDQVRSVVESVSARSGKGGGDTIITVGDIMPIANATFEDEIDIKAAERVAGTEIEQILRKYASTGGAK